MILRALGGQVRIVFTREDKRDRLATPLHPGGMPFPFLLGRAVRDPGDRALAA